MAEIATIARPYAEAAFRTARESGQLTAWSEALRKLAAAASIEEMASCLNSPSLSNAQKTDLLGAVLGTAQTAEIANFLTLLAENGRLTALPAIAEAFAALHAREEGVRDAVVLSAFPLSEAQRDALLPTLEAHFGGRLRVSVQTQPDLIGGIRVLVGDQMLDASVRGKLDAMKSALTH